MQALSEIEFDLFSEPRRPGGCSEEQIAALFALPSDDLSLERELDDRISTLISEFLDSRNASSRMDLEMMATMLRDSNLRRAALNPFEYLDYINENIVAHSIHTSSPRFIGHMTTALPYFVRPLARLITAMNQNMVKVETAKALTAYENQTLAMMHRLIFDRPEDFYERHVQQPDSTLGVVTSGGTVANITALWCARNSRLGPSGGFAGVEREGLSAALKAHGYRGAAIAGSSLMHYSIDKAAEILGIGTSGLIKVPVDCENRVDPVALRRVVRRCHSEGTCLLAIVGIAGTTDSGSIDPLFDLAEIAREARAHFHVDAAWGGPLLFSTTHRTKLAGIELADSVTIDGHKQLYLPMGLGLIMLSDPSLARSIERHARYIVRAGSSDLGRRSLEGSRPAMSMLLHAALNMIGASGYEQLIDAGISKARYMADCVSFRDEFELLGEPQTNIVNYRYVPRSWKERLTADRVTAADNQHLNEINERLQRAQRSEGCTFVSRTTLEATKYGPGQQVTALRAVLANPLTTESDIEAVLDDQSRIARDLLKTDSWNDDGACLDLRQ